MALLKLAFFADRSHVRRYPRPISSDEYYALKLGPIPSNLRDIISTERYYPENVSFINDHEVALKSKAIDVDQFSKSDIEAMNFAVEKFARLVEKN